MAFLRHPQAWPGGEESVEVVETHMSWVFLTTRFAYKLKKPVRLPWLDFTTIDARHRNCLTELEVNRRLSPHIYLDVVPLCTTVQGLRVGSGGRVVDWLLRMQRLPAGRSLEALIRGGAAGSDEVHSVAGLLAEFYARCDPVEIAPHEYRERFAAEIADNRRELIAFGLPSAETSPVCNQQAQFLGGNGALLDSRVERIVDGHGDLRPEHLFLTDPPAIIDALEFSRELRLIDPVDELGYLALECERLRSPATAKPFFTFYEKRTGDRYPSRLLDFYQSFRATVRARISVWHNRNGEASDPGHWIKRAREYLRLASDHADRIQSPPHS